MQFGIGIYKAHHISTKLGPTNVEEWGEMVTIVFSRTEIIYLKYTRCVEYTFGQLNLAEDGKDTRACQGI